MNEKERAEKAKTRICEKCTHEQCNTSLCPLEHVTFEDLLNYYEYGTFSV